ncbi:MAG: hypothetical protein JXR63_02940 [Spirochaetales bacterium]|nr:hypothetical protein [Spirochaetales bacterium]
MAGVANWCRFFSFLTYLILTILCYGCIFTIDDLFGGYEQGNIKKSQMVDLFGGYEQGNIKKSQLDDLMACFQVIFINKMKIIFLSDSFRKDYPQYLFPELISKAERPYLMLKISIDGIDFAISKIFFSTIFS